MSAHNVVSPAYGRVYTSAKAAKADWAAGKDFTMENVGRYMGKPCSIRDFPEGDTMEIRYGKNGRLTELTIVKIGDV